jgi:hypothetical protein
MNHAGFYRIETGPGIPYIEFSHGLLDVWRDVKRRHLAHQTFASADDLERGIHHAFTDLNRERMHHPLDNQRVSA